MQKVLDASRTSSLPDQEKLQYFRAMISETEKEDIAVANYQDGYLDGMEKGKEEVAREMLRMGLETKIISQATGLTEAQVRAL